MSALCRSRAALLAALSAVAAIALLLPSLASAFLPDGRVYEQVSPPYKNGNYVAGGAFGLASEDGNAVVYVGTGAMGESFSSNINEFDSHRTPSGWTTRSAIPRQQSPMSFASGPMTVVPSSDFNKYLFTSYFRWVSTEPEGPSSSSNIFLSENPAEEALWIAQPQISDALPAPGENNSSKDYVVAGQSPDLGTVYFTYQGTLLAGDAGRATHLVAPGGAGGARTEPWGFYEWNDGVLGEAGTLPDGSLNPYGAVPAAIGFDNFRSGQDYQAQLLDNEVSKDGKRTFFVSPDPVASTVTHPASCNEYPGTCTSEAPELYLRESHSDGSHTVELVSHSQLPGSEGQPAPGGVSPVATAITDSQAGIRPPTFAFASPDGSHVFFVSADRLTSSAPEDETLKEYDFDASTGALTYLPGVTGPLVVAADGGSSFAFENTTTSPHELDLWKSGEGGGSVRTITPLPEPPAPADVNAGRMVANGSVLVFRTNARISGFNSGGYEQVYRYDAITERLDCVSCPPEGVTPSGGARVSYNSAEGGEYEKVNGYNSEPMTTLDTRIVSSDGSRVFFDTPDALLQRDSNGRRDAYEWENGQLYLISSGKSAEDSFIVDSSANGSDAFFITDSGLVSGDTDDANDAYDARIPHPGDNPPPSAVPCQGDVCQGPPSVPSLLGLPASATFNGLGNVTPAQPTHVTPKSLTRKQKLARALKVCKRRKGARARARCRQQARRRYGAKGAGSRPNRGKKSHSNGRGN